jgi:hypothetical protein
MGKEPVRQSWFDTLYCGPLGCRKTTFCVFFGGRQMAGEVSWGGMAGMLHYKGRARNETAWFWEETGVFRKLIGLVAILLGVAWLGGKLVGDAKEPPYRVVRHAGRIEIREYEAMVLAEVVVSGDTRQDAAGTGFKVLADYIFGGNEQREKLPMTTPVMQQEMPDGQWMVAFVMPSGHTLATLPEPFNTAVALRAFDHRQVMVGKLSGTPTEQEIAALRQEMIHLSQTWEATLVGQPLAAYYNPPWTPTPLRRNELLWELR